MQLFPTDTKLVLTCILVLVLLLLAIVLTPEVIFVLPPFHVIAQTLEVTLVLPLDLTIKRCVVRYLKEIFKTISLVGIINLKL